MIAQRLTTLVFSLVVSSSAWAQGGLDGFDQGIVEAARTYLQNSLSEQGYSIENLESALANISIDQSNISIESTGSGGIWCKAPVEYKISIPHPFGESLGWNVTIVHYRPRSWNSRSHETKSSVIVVPATGGDDRLERTHAWHLCDIGTLEVFRVASWGGDAGVNRERVSVEREVNYIMNHFEELDIHKHDRGTNANIAAIKVATLLFSHLNDLQPGAKPIGILGNSVGAIASYIKAGDGGQA